jgi:hypothetical protein
MSTVGLAATQGYPRTEMKKGCIAATLVNTGGVQFTTERLAIGTNE